MSRLGPVVEAENGGPGRGCSGLWLLHREGRRRPGKLGQGASVMALPASKPLHTLFLLPVSSRH